MKGKIARRLFHLIGGSVPPLLGLVLERSWLLWVLGSVAAIFVIIEALRILVEPVNRWVSTLFSRASTAFKEREAARPIGSTYYLVASFVAFLFFDRDVTVAALLFAAIGDPAAATFGERFGRTRVGQKSLEGSAAFLVAALIVGSILVMAGFRLTWIAAAVGAVVATLVELTPIPIDDNLTVPLISALALAVVLMTGF